MSSNPSIGLDKIDAQIDVSSPIQNKFSGIKYPSNFVACHYQSSRPTFVASLSQNMKPKLTAKRYYKAIESAHMTGDIWMNMPTLGILKTTICSGLVITPACDLANAKVETITYLPIIPIKTWLASRPFYYEARNQFLNISKDKLPRAEEILLKNRVPKLSEMDFIDELAKNLTPKSKNENLLTDRIKDGIQILKTVITSSELKCNEQKLRNFLGDKMYATILTKLLRNSYSNDIHFLPRDLEPVEWSAIPFHSLVLFRYPITIPIEILDLANDQSCVDWETEISAMETIYPIAKTFKAAKPLKTLSLEDVFLSDLLTRFVGLYVRIGSPDFTNDTIQELIKEI